MDTIHKFEKQIEEWLKPLPHLPTDWRKWIAHNVWWIVLVGVILSVLGVLGLISTLSTANQVTTNANSILNSLGVSVAPVHDGLWYTAIIVSLVFLVITIIINAMAVTPLRVLSKKGWDLLFLTFLVGVVSSIVSVVLNITTASVVGSVIGGVIGVVISAYFLFEIRSYFK